MKNANLNYCNLINADISNCNLINANLEFIKIGLFELNVYYF